MGELSGFQGRLNPIMGLLMDGESEQAATGGDFPILKDTKEQKKEIRILPRHSSVCPHAWFLCPHKQTDSKTINLQERELSFCVCLVLLLWSRAEHHRLRDGSDSPQPHIVFSSRESHSQTLLALARPSWIYIGGPCRPPRTYPCLRRGRPPAYSFIAHER